MSKQKNNIVMKGAQGMFGDQVVFKQRAGETILAAPPVVNPEREITTAEELTRLKFKRCIFYAKGAIKDPAVKAIYNAIAKPGQSAFNVAFTDVYHGPEILEINTDNYDGVAGNILLVQAIDNVKVNAVKVRIASAADVLIEEGDAELTEDGTTWRYTATAANANVAGSKILAIATDIPLNEGRLEVTV